MFGSRSKGLALTCGIPVTVDFSNDRGETAIASLQYKTRDAQKTTAPGRSTGRERQHVIGDGAHPTRGFCSNFSGKNAVRPVQLPGVRSNALSVPVALSGCLMLSAYHDVVERYCRIPRQLQVRSGEIRPHLAARRLW